MPETKPERTVAPDPADFDRGALEGETASKLSDIFKDGDETLVEGAAPAATEAAPAKEAEAATETPAETEAPETAAAEGQAEKPTAVTTPAAPLVPAAYRRSLKAYQWSDEEIDQAAKANPDGFLKTAEKIHMNRVQETQRWAELGRAQKTAPAAKTEDKPKVFQPIDVASLRAKYGDEPFVLELEKMNENIKLQSEVVDFMNASKQRQQASELADLTKQVDSYFSSKELEPYADHYGKNGQTLTDKQLAERQKVLETADLLISGARSMNRPITLDEALTMAHDSMSSPIAAKAAVKKVETQVRARQASITLRPGSRSTTLPAETRKDMEKRVGAGLAKVFGRE